MFNNGAPEPPSLWDQAKALIDQGEYDKAAEIYDYILLTYSDNDAAVEYASACLGDLYLTTLRLDLSKRHLKKAILLNPVDPGYHYLLGFAYMVKEQWRKAIREFRKAHEADPDNGEYERCLGWAIFNSGDRQNGLCHLYRAIELSPSSTNALTDLATALMMLGDVDRARKFGEKAVEADPGSVLAQRLMDTVRELERTVRSQN